MSDIPHVRIRSLQGGPEGWRYEISDSDTGKMRTDVVGFKLEVDANHVALVYLTTVAIVDELDARAVEVTP